MGKLKLAAELIKLNNKLGLLDIGDMIGLASTAYKIKTFDPMDHVPEFDFFVDEEMERAERRKTLLIAGAAAGTAYLLYKNRDAISKAFDNRKEIAPEIAKGVEEVVDDTKKESKKAVESIDVKNSFYKK